MQVVIDIPSKWFDDMVKEKFTEVDELCAVIQHGTLLPEGHGDLIDRSKIAFDWWSVHGHTCVGKESIFNMPVIVPREVGDAE